MNTIKNPLMLSLTAAGIAMLAGCNSSSDGDGNEDGLQPANTGTLNLSVSDSPIKNAAKVCIKFDGVQLKKADQDAPIDIDFDAPVVVNLMANQGARSETLASAEVEAGTYEWIRLKVDAVTGTYAGIGDTDTTDPACIDKENGSYLLTDTGGAFKIWIPSDGESGLKLVRQIAVPANGSVDYTAEWDLGKSYVGPPVPPSEVTMRPVIRLVKNDEVGTLDGTVADSLAGSCGPDTAIPPSVYVFDDDGNPDNPVNEASDGTKEPFSTGRVAQAMQGMPHVYEIGFLPAGRYEVAFTCNGTDFIPETGKVAEILVGDPPTTVDFVGTEAPFGDPGS